MIAMFEKNDRALLFPILYVAALPLYFFVFTILLRPAWIVPLAGQEEFMGWVVRAASDILVSLVIMRFIYRYVGDRVSKPLWYVAEIFAMSVAFSLSADLYRENFALSVAYIFLVYSLPLWALHTRLRLSEAIRSGKTTFAEDKMRFYDNKGRLKLVIPSDDLVYIQADDNDIRINYLDGNEVRVLVVRNTLKSIGEICQYYGMLQSHRSYIVNPLHVTWLGRGDDAEIYAQLDIPDMPHIPVTKRYYDRIEEKILSQNRQCKDICQ